MKRDLNLSLDTVIETLFYFYKLFFFYHRNVHEGERERERVEAIEIAVA